jgi:FAD dependent oxidoreductase
MCCRRKPGWSSAGVASRAPPSPTNWPNLVWAKRRFSSNKDGSYNFNCVSKKNNANHTSCFRLGGGSTWHSSGLIFTLRNTFTETRLARESVALYKELDAQGLKTGWRQCGSLSIARNKDRMTMFRRIKARAQLVIDQYYLIAENNLHNFYP